MYTPGSRTEDRSNSLGRRSKSRGGTLSRSSSQDSFKSARSEFRHTDAASSAAEEEHGKCRPVVLLCYKFKF